MRARDFFLPRQLIKAFCWHNCFNAGIWKRSNQPGSGGLFFGKEKPWEKKNFSQKGSYERKAGKAWSLSAFGGSNPPPCIRGLRLLPEVKIGGREAAELEGIRREIKQGETISEKELFSILLK